MAKKKYVVADDAAALIQHYSEGGTQATLLKNVMTQHRYKNALRHIRETTKISEATDIKDATVEQPVVAEEKPAKPGKSEKAKPVMLTKVPVVNANLPKGVVHRYVITAAQDDTPIFHEFFESLSTFCNAMDAPLITCGLTYQKGLFEDHAVDAARYDPTIESYMLYHRVQLTKDILLISDANVLPTTANPLNGWTTANRGGHVIVPSTRIALESIPRMQGKEPRFAITTGCITRPSYTPRAAGRKSITHHTYGALFIEIDTDGTMFPFHLLPADDGSFQWLDMIVDGGNLTVGNAIEAATWADVHHDQLDEVIAMSTWGYCVHKKKKVTRDCLQDFLNARHEFVQDTDDFRFRNHHDDHDPHRRAHIRAHTVDNVEAEVRDAANFVNEIARDGCKTVVVESNHDAAIARWLKNPAGQYDSENAYYWHRLNAIWHDEIRRGNSDFNPVHESLRLAGLGDHIDFISGSESYTVLGIEHGLHGDLGIGGSKGTPQQFRRFGVKTSTGHTHSPKIVDGAYVAGVAGKLFMGYNKGPTTWAHAHIVLYQNGQRGLIIMHSDGRFFAMGDRVHMVDIVELAA